MVSKSAFFDEEGNYAGELAMVTDITERRRLSRLLESEQRLEEFSVRFKMWSGRLLPSPWKPFTSIPPPKRFMGDR
jgi:hypothetical protein